LIHLRICDAENVTAKVDGPDFFNFTIGLSNPNMTKGSIDCSWVTMPTNSGSVLQEASVTPTKSSLLDYITINKNVLTPEHCQRLIDRFEASAEVEVCRRRGYSFSQLEITTAWPDENALLLQIFVENFQKYKQITNAIYWPANIAFEHIRVKRYLPNEQDFFVPHVDVMDQVSARRFITAIIYLNDPEGGETIFPDLGLSVAPETGKLLVFPPLWLFPHEGRAPRSIPKYILHTYLCYGA
jgi:prolyl 4-hydroxylase